MPELRDEKELEDYLFLVSQDPNEKGNSIDVAGKCFRQVNITGYGIIDLLYIDFEYGYISPNGNMYSPQINITIVELKKDLIDLLSDGIIFNLEDGSWFNKTEDLTSLDKIKEQISNNYIDVYKDHFKNLKSINNEQKENN